MPRYIAAPYAADTPEGIRWNIARAELLGKLALAQGHTPIVPHTLGAALLGADETPETREAALRYGLDLVSIVAGAGGELWVLTRDDGSISDGCLAEIRQFRLAHRRSYPEVLARSWRDVRADCDHYGLASEWERLSVSPTVPLTARAAFILATVGSEIARACDYLGDRKIARDFAQILPTIEGDGEIAAVDLRWWNPDRTFLGATTMTLTPPGTIAGPGFKHGEYVAGGRLPDVEGCSLQVVVHRYDDRAVDTPSDQHRETFDRVDAVSGAVVFESHPPRS